MQDSLDTFAFRYYTLNSSYNSFFPYCIDFKSIPVNTCIVEYRKRHPGEMSDKRAS
jgi:hypothetical protein